MKAWVARHNYLGLSLFNTKPVKYPKIGLWQEQEENWYKDGTWYLDIPEGLLPPDINPQWEDEEPTEIEITIKLAKPDETIQS